MVCFGKYLFFYCSYNSFVHNFYQYVRHIIPANADDAEVSSYYRKRQLFAEWDLRRGYPGECVSFETDRRDKAIALYVRMFKDREDMVYDCDQLKFTLSVPRENRWPRDFQYCNVRMEEKIPQTKPLNKLEQEATHIFGKLETYSLIELSAAFRRFRYSSIRVKYGADFDRKHDLFSDIILIFIYERLNRSIESPREHTTTLFKLNPVVHCKNCQYIFWEGLTTYNHCLACHFTKMTRFHTDIFELYGHYHECNGALQCELLEDNGELDARILNDMSFFETIFDSINYVVEQPDNNAIEHNDNVAEHEGEWLEDYAVDLFANAYTRINSSGHLWWQNLSFPKYFAQDCCFPIIFARRDIRRDVDLLSIATYLKPDVELNSFRLMEINAAKSIKSLGTYSLDDLRELYENRRNRNIEIKCGPAISRKIYKYEDIVCAFGCKRIGRPFDTIIDLDQAVINPKPYCTKCVENCCRTCRDPSCELCVFALRTLHCSPFFELDGHLKTCNLVV